MSALPIRWYVNSYLLCLVLGCSPSPSPSFQQSTLEVSTSSYSGQYSQAMLTGDRQPYLPGHPSLDLELLADGTYDGFVCNGVTADGCSTFVGAGALQGRWSIVDEGIEFHPHSEPPGIVLSLQGARAFPAEHGGLLVKMKGAERWVIPPEMQDKEDLSNWESSE